MVFGYEILYDAWRESSKGKRSAPNQEKYLYNLEDNLYSLQGRLESGSFHPSPLRKKQIYIPKRRVAQVPCLEDKIVQHAICDNYAYMRLTKPLIPEVSACIVGRGDTYATALLKKHLHSFFRKYGRRPYILRCDIHKYFASIPHDRLKQLIARYISDEGVRRIIEQFVDLTGPVGISLGLQQSQLLANTYLSEMDHRIKEQLRVRWYNRHMDDFLMLFATRQEAENAWAWVDEYVQSIGLTLNEKTYIEYGKTDFLGFSFRMTDSGKVIARLKKDKHTTEKHRLRLLARQLAAGDKSPQAVADAYQGWRAHALQGNTRNLVLKMDERFCTLLNEEGYILDISKKGKVAIWPKH